MSLALHPTISRVAAWYTIIALKQTKTAFCPLYDPCSTIKRPLSSRKTGHRMDTGAADTSGNCRITAYSLNKIDMDVTSAKKRLLVLSEIHYPS